MSDSRAEAAAREIICYNADQLGHQEPCFKSVDVAAIISRHYAPVVAENERLRGAVADREVIVIGQRHKIEELQIRLAKVEEAARPFTNRGIPPNWPGGCVLTYENDYQNESKGCWLSYLSIKSQGGPTIDQWRALDAALGGKVQNANK